MHKILSAAVYGIDAFLVEVEVDLNPARSDSHFTTVGLPDAAVKESSDRIRAALRNCGYNFPAQNVTVNLAPADMKKEGSGFDLPIALGVLAGMGELEGANLANYMFLGELSLDGLLRPVRGALSIASKARELGITNLIVPLSNGREAAAVEDRDVGGPLQRRVQPRQDRGGGERHLLVLLVAAAQLQRAPGGDVDRLRRVARHQPGMDQRLEHPHQQLRPRHQRGVADLFVERVGAATVGAQPVEGRDAQRRGKVSIADAAGERQLAGIGDRGGRQRQRRNGAQSRQWRRARSDRGKSGQETPAASRRLRGSLD